MQDALEKYGTLSDAVATASVLGAGITYTTIFNALRGNIGLMCWSFALFDVGLIITILFRSIMTALWHFQLPRKPFATVFWWELMIKVVLLMALISATIAIFLLSMSALQLVYPRPEGYQDAVQLTMSPVPSAALSMFIVAGGIAVLVGVFALLFWAGGFRKDDNPREAVQDYFV
ncbi:hypothetical protein SCP_0209910 [Sparassis crispa]|uniref:Uncharacterized protein n=1 Tax=Sparassis crispa TaxID=139825 RepID=A0A401GCA2_9APHY|nr:hypothetical protein SCP_0209910 [Sparassis crispa]GBE79790.1 hypothetical protein SCP_0209910 [Sparassis crispa]